MVVLIVIDKTRQLFQWCREVDRFDELGMARFEKLATESSIDINFYLDFFYRIRNGCDDSVFAQDDVYGQIYSLSNTLSNFLSNNLCSTFLKSCTAASLIGTRR